MYNPYCELIGVIFSVMPGWLFAKVVAGKRDYSNCTIKLLTVIFKMTKSALESHLESNRLKKNCKRQASRASRLGPQNKGSTCTLRAGKA